MNNVVKMTIEEKANATLQNYRLRAENEYLNELNDIYMKRIDKAIEYITNNFADINYIKQVYGEEVVDEDETTVDLKNIKELLDILKGEK